MLSLRAHVHRYFMALEDLDVDRANAELRSVHRVAGEHPQLTVGFELAWLNANQALIGARLDDAER